MRLKLVRRLYAFFSALSWRLAARSSQGPLFETARVSLPRIDFNKNQRSNTAQLAATCVRPRSSSTQANRCSEPLTTHTYPSTERRREGH